MPVYQLPEEPLFPSPELAEKDGLLAVGGDLSPERLLNAYALGIFPWYSDDSPILWWSPDPRLILVPSEITISRSLKQVIRRKEFRVTFDTAFVDIIRQCAAARRKNSDGTWITEDMIEAYCRLHELGLAHSIEAWHDGILAGGLYGVSIGAAFFGESMFSDRSNASKVCLAKLAELLEEWKFDFIDCQIKTRHLISLGAREISRKRFLRMLDRSLAKPTRRGKWQME